MITRLILAIVVITALFLLLHWFRTRPPELVSRRLKIAALYFVILLLIFLAVTGRLSWIFAFIASLIPLLRRVLPYLRYTPVFKYLYRRLQNRASNQPGQTSSIKTRYLDMRLNHQTGEIDGIILAGQHQGQRLSQLSNNDLKSCLLDWRQNDTASARLLQVYIQQYSDSQFQQDHDSDEKEPINEQMTETEALAILGLKLPVDQETVTQTHRRLIQKFHPDRGGSTYLAVKINQAKDYLLKQDNN